MANSTIGAGARRVANSAFAVLAVSWLAGCSMSDPVNWYRDAMGLSDTDPSDDTRNSDNLAAGGKRDFPNLASVPPPPTRALSTAERDALTQRLVSDRANAKYIDDQLRGGPSAAVARPPAAPSAASAAATVPAPAEPPAAPREAAAPTPSVAASAAPPPTPPPTPAPPPAATSTAAPAAKAAPFVSLTAPPPVASAPTAPAQAAATPAPPAVDESGQPRESPLTSPSVRSVPEPEAPRAPPPPPSLARGSAAPAPPPASAPPSAPASQLAARTPASEPVAAVGAPVAQVTFPDNSARLTPSDRRIVGEVVPLQRQNGGALRIVGYAAAGRGAGAAQQLAHFRMALDRANAVASALTQAGIAPDQILVETAPPTGETGVAANRAEIFLEN
jgi:outer membrane protein OmpA-like peptidoglycan-associated protein